MWAVVDKDSSLVRATAYQPVVLGLIPGPIEIFIFQYVNNHTGNKINNRIKSLNFQKKTIYVLQSSTYLVERETG